MSICICTIERAEWEYFTHLELKDWSIYRLSTVTFEAADDGFEDTFSDRHLLGIVISSALKE